MYNLSTLNRDLADTIYADKLYWMRVTGSTNEDARQGARCGTAHGSVYLADEQTAGRGRSDHGWESVAGAGLYVSVLLRPRLHARLAQWLPMAAGMAAVDAIGACSGLVVDLRWPNDLLIGSRKVGGLLVEAKLSLSADALVESVVVGVGINVHQREFASVQDATSIDLECDRACDAGLLPGHIPLGPIPLGGVLLEDVHLGCVPPRVESAGRVRRTDRQSLLAALLRTLQRELDGLLTEGGVAALKARVESASSWMVGRSVRVHGPQACVGKTRGLDAIGMLRVQTETQMITVQTGGIRDAAGLDGEIPQSGV